MTIQVVKEPQGICDLLRKFDDVLPHLKEKISDYCIFSNKLAEHATVLSLVDGEYVCGFVAFYANDIATRTAFVTLIACSSEYQGRGLGRQLMEIASREALSRGMSKIRLEVDLDNSGAIAFYTRLGFSENGEKKFGSMYMEKALL